MKAKFALDIDNADSEEMAHFLAFLMKRKRLKKGAVRVSSGKTGYHVKIEYVVPKYFGKHFDMKAFKLGMRYALGDCLGRMKADVSRMAQGMGTDRLFYRKDGKNAGKWKDFK